MSINSMAWLYTASSLIRIAILIVAFIFALINWSKSPRAALILLAGLTFMIMSTLIISIGIPLSSWVRTSNYPEILGILSFLSSILSTFGVVLIVFAVFVDRSKKPAVTEKFETITLGTNDNPYQVSQPTQI